MNYQNILNKLTLNDCWTKFEIKIVHFQYKKGNNNVQ